ncbi:hypothetical protein L873DRAFT_1787140 [Choiromyces venosus 120613-1]|uniref:Multicopper oxidase n=1 Tax=Choiromyces venosus 120613-1 TaxID=1336337 RepID=A0A3N4JYB8_9PEZI|nr:hypothetical protein L873DRAFT_1787140 [Choiromyces venosus 120613-1]
MHLTARLAAAILVTTASALHSPFKVPTTEVLAPALIPRQTSNCINSATTRTCWDGVRDIHTDYYTDFPLTGNVREYWLSVENSTFAPDGYKRTMLTFNGTFPGPTLYADWGDTVRIHIKNNMEYNGTSIHWHGIRQLDTNEQDGANGVTQCPIAPGYSLTYEWNATQYGTTWYHSHFSVQYSEGVAGAIVINGPASANYDVDLGPIILDDWYHSTAFSLLQALGTSGPPATQNGLINGTNVFDCSTSTDANCVGGGKRFVTEFEAGKKYLLRFINMATDTFFKVSLDNHNMTVISTDFVPIIPYKTEFLSIGIGQRYEVIIEANQATDNYWLRATVQTACSATNANALNIKGIVRYSGATSTDPTTSTRKITESCADELKDTLVPVVVKDVPSTDLRVSQNVDVTLTVADNIILWTLNGISGLIDWSSPTLLKVANGQTYPESYHVLNIDGTNAWYYLVIETSLGITHPIHLHGHDFYLIAQETGTFNASSLTANWSNPPRRDVAMLPGNGFIVLAFEADNPGVWLMHCHIAWHVSGGFSLQFLEREADLLSEFSTAGAFSDTCAAWNSYVASGIDPPQEDSGLKKRLHKDF